MLTSYLANTRRLLQNPASAGTALYSDADLTNYINIGRGQLAGEAECIRGELVLSTTINQNAYAFSNIPITVPGAQGVLNVRRIQYSGGFGGRTWIYQRSWEWFDFYYYKAFFGPPQNWAQYGQGSGGDGTITGVGGGGISSGSFFLGPIPDQPYVLFLDCTCYPRALAADGDFEAIPYPWTDAVPFWAAWYALMSSQTQARMADADKFKAIYDDFVQRARKASNPSVGRWKYEQAMDPVQMAKILHLPSSRGAA